MYFERTFDRNVISVGTCSKIFGFSFFGGVIQLTDIVQHDIIEALTYDFVLASSKALERTRSVHRLNDMPF